MSDNDYKVLIIDDDPPIRKLLKVSLSAHGYLIEEAASARDGINRAAFSHPDIIILDLGLPDFDGKKAIKEIREWSKTPIIILTARDQQAEKITALDAGADDYLTKPFGIGELLARIRVCIRRFSQGNSEPVVQCGDLTVDFVQRRVLVGEREIKLTPTEYELMKILAQNAGRVLTHQQLLKAIWGNTYSEDTHYIRVYIGQLRRKIESEPARPRYIITESGVGYRLLCP